MAPQEKFIFTEVVTALQGTQGAQWFLTSAESSSFVSSGNVHFTFQYVMLEAQRRTLTGYCCDGKSQHGGTHNYDDKSHLT